MIREFEVLDVSGDRLMHGEIDGNIYRVFSDKFENGFQEFSELSELLDVCGGFCIQPVLFETEARPRQLSLFRGE